MTDERLDAASGDESAAEASPAAFDLNAAAENDAPANEGETARARRLERSVSDRMVTGVAGGIAEYLAVDPAFVRLAFVLVTVFGAGVGLLAYLVACVVMPRGLPDVAASSARAPFHDRPSSGGVTFGLLLILVGVLALLTATEAIDPGGDAILVGLSALLVLIGALILVQARRGLDGALVFWGIIVTAVLVIALQVDLSFESGFGERRVSVEGAAQLERSYSHAFGSLHVDLRTLDVAPGTTERVAIDIAFGELVVELPREIGWRVEAEAVFSSVELSGRNVSGIASDGVATSSDWETADRRVEIDISAAFGSAEVRP